MNFNSPAYDIPQSPDTIAALDILKKFDEQEIGLLVKYFTNDSIGTRITENKVLRRRFTRDEDAKLKRIVESYIKENKEFSKQHKIDWKEIANIMGDGLTVRQCKERYLKYLSPEVSSKPWTKAEDTLLLQLYDTIGPKWIMIAKHFTNRTDVNIKNRWITIVRRQEKEKNKMFSSFNIE